MDNRLKIVARAGDINLFYTLIGVDPCLLDNLDNISFVETPLHVAALLGHAEFAAEIMRLKPSFSEKPNKQGHTPLQVALQNGKIDTVRRLIAINPQLIRIKGREGMTPLHFVAQNGDIELLNHFLLACPLSIMETTIRNENALHIAMKNRSFDAFNVLMGRLKRALHKDSLDMQVKILDAKDGDGNTLLHIAAQTNQLQVVEVILNCRPRVKINEKNLAGLTALDISALQFPAENEIKKMLQHAGALTATSIADHSHHVNSKMSFLEHKRIESIRHERGMSEEKLNIAVVIMVLIATITYQAMLSPPGGVWQDSNNSNTTSTNGSSLMHQVGTSTLPSYFLFFSILNSVTLMAAITNLLFLLSSDYGSIYIYFPLYMLGFSFIYSMSIIWQNSGIPGLVYIPVMALPPLAAWFITHFRNTTSFQETTGFHD